MHQNSMLIKKMGPLNITMFPITMGSNCCALTTKPFCFCFDCLQLLSNTIPKETSDRNFTLLTQKKKVVTIEISKMHKYISDATVNRTFRIAAKIKFILITRNHIHLNHDILFVQHPIKFVQFMRKRMINASLSAI